MLALYTSAIATPIRIVLSTNTYNSDRFTSFMQHEVNVLNARRCYGQRPIEFSSLPSGCGTQDQLDWNAQHLDKNFSMIIGPTCSSNAAVLIPELASRNTLAFGTRTGRPSLTPSSNYLRIEDSGKTTVQELSKIWRELGFTRVTVVDHPDVSKAASFEASGFNVTYVPTTNAPEDILGAINTEYPLYIVPTGLSSDSLWIDDDTVYTEARANFWTQLQYKCNVNNCHRYSNGYFNTSQCGENSYTSQRRVLDAVTLAVLKSRAMQNPASYANLLANNLTLDAFGNELGGGPLGLFGLAPAGDDPYYTDRRLVRFLLALNAYMQAIDSVPTLVEPHVTCSDLEGVWSQNCCGEPNSDVEAQLVNSLEQRGSINASIVYNFLLSGSEFSINSDQLDWMGMYTASFDDSGDNVDGGVVGAPALVSFPCET